MDYQFLGFAVGVSLLMLGIIFFKRGLKDPLFWVSAYYFYFTLGPIINLLLGGDIYVGIVRTKIPDAITIYLIGLFTFTFVSLFIKPREVDPAHLHHSTNCYALNFVLVLLIAYQLFIFITRGPSALGRSKIVQIELLGGTLHYNFLLLQYFVISFFFLLKNSKISVQLYIINFLLYIVYCISFQERDFIFLIISLMIHFYVFKVKTLSLSHLLQAIILIIVLVILATSIFALRLSNVNSNSAFQSVLNQGSLLFINTQVVNMIDTGQPFLNGATYLNSLANLLPSSIYRTDFSLLTWFKYIYAPGGDSGYGFALDAEAYLNFGHLGVLGLFLILGLVQRYMFNRVMKHRFYVYFSVFFTSFLMYTLRSDSLALFKGTLYAIVFFGLISLFSLPALNAHESHHLSGTQI